MTDFLSTFQKENTHPSKKQQFIDCMKEIQNHSSNATILRKLCNEAIIKFSPYSRYKQHSKYIHVWLTLISTYSGDIHKQIELIAKMQKEGVGIKSQLFYRAKVRILEAYELNARTLKEIYDTFVTGLENCTGENRDLLIDELGDFHFERLPEYISSLPLEDAKNKMRKEKVAYLKPILGIHLSFEELRAYSPQHLYSTKIGRTLLTEEEVKRITEIDEDLSDDMDTTTSMGKSHGTMNDDENDVDDGTFTNHSMSDDDNQTFEGAQLRSQKYQSGNLEHSQNHHSQHTQSYLQHQDLHQNIHQNDKSYHNREPAHMLSPLPNNVLQSTDDFSLYADYSTHSLSEQIANANEISTNHASLNKIGKKESTSVSGNTLSGHVALMQNIRTSLSSMGSRFSFLPQHEPAEKVPSVPPDTTLHTKEALIDIGSMFQGPIDEEFDNYFEQRKDFRKFRNDIQEVQKQQNRQPLQTIPTVQTMQSRQIEPIPYSQNSYDPSADILPMDDLSLDLSQTFNHGQNMFASEAGFMIREDTTVINPGANLTSAPHSQIEGTSINKANSESLRTGDARRESLPSARTFTSVQNASRFDRRYSTIPGRTKRVSFNSDATLSGIGERLKAEATHHRRSISSSLSIISNNAIDSAGPALTQLYRSLRISPEDSIEDHIQVFQLLWKYHIQKEDNPFILVNEKQFPNHDILQSKIGKVSLIQIGEMEAIVNSFHKDEKTQSVLYELDDAQSGLCWIRGQKLNRAVWEFYIMNQVRQRLLKEENREWYLQPKKLYTSSATPNGLSYLLTKSPQTFPIASLIQCYRDMNQKLPEYLVMYLTVELLKMVAKLHTCSFQMNDSLSENHIYFRLQLQKRGQPVWTSSGVPHCGLLFTNFSHVVDYSLHLKPGSPVEDYFTLAQLIHLLLANQELNADCNGRFVNFQDPLYQNDLWSFIFDTLLPKQGQELRTIHDTTKVFSPLIAQLEKHLESKKDKVYKSLINANARTKRWISEQRRP